MAKPKISASKSIKHFPSMRADEKDKPLSARQMSPNYSNMVAQAIKSQRADGWSNVITGAGVRGRDKRTAGRLEWTGLMPEIIAEQTYAADELARRLIELPAAGALQNWVKFQNMDDTQQDVEEEVDRLKVEARFYEAACWADLYGGSALFMATGEDPEDFELPLDPTKIDRIQSLVLFSKWELLVTAPDLESDINDPNYAHPKYYRLTPRKGNISNIFSVKIHHSRLIIFQGKQLPLRLKVFNRYWGDSVYTGVVESLRDYASSHASVAAILQDFRTTWYKMKELTEGLGSVDSKAINDRMETLAAVKSVFGMYFLDMDEEIESKMDPLTGVKDALQAMKECLQAHTAIPHILLFNESPGGGGGSASSGMGTSGDSSLKVWYDYLASRQKNYFTPKLDQLLTTILQAPGGPTQGQEPDGWDYEWNSPETMSESDKEDLEGKKHDNDSKAMANGIDSQLDILEKRRPEKYKELGIKEGARQKAALLSLEAAESERFGTPADIKETNYKNGNKKIQGTGKKEPLIKYRDQTAPTSKFAGPVPAKGEQGKPSPNKPKKGL